MAGFLLVYTLWTHQLRPPRSSRLLNPPRSPPLPPPNPPLPPPAPPPPPNPRFSRGAIGLASFTTIVRPSNALPFSSWIAFCASSSELISTNPNPRDLPENLSIMITADPTVPTPEKKLRRDSSVVSHESPPTNNFVAILYHLLPYPYYCARILPSGDTLNEQKG